MTPSRDVEVEIDVNLRHLREGSKRKIVGWTSVHMPSSGAYITGHSCESICEVAVSKQRKDVFGEAAEQQK